MKKQNHKKTYLIIFLAAFLMSGGIAGSFYLTIKKSRNLSQNKMEQAQKSQKEKQFNQIQETESFINFELDQLEKDIENVNADESYLDNLPAL